MQACKHNLRGSNKKFGFMSTVTNPQVSSNEHTHTANGSSLYTDIESPVGRKSPKRSTFIAFIFYSHSLASLCFCFTLYNGISSSEFLGSFFSPPSVCIEASSHSDGKSLAHLLSDDFLTVFQALSVVSRQRSSQPQQIPAKTTANRSVSGFKGSSP